MSSREQEQEGYSLDVQEQEIKRLAARDGNEIQRTIRIVESASDARSRELYGTAVAEVRAAAVAGRLKALYFHRVDRATRNFSDLADLELLQKSYGVRVRFVTPDLDTAHPAGELLLGVLACVAKAETGTRVEQVKASQRKRVESGLFVGRAPYGYANVREGARGRVRTDERAADNVRLIFTLFATGTFTVRSLMRELSDREIWYTTKSKCFGKNKLHKILRDRSYVGDVFYNGQWYPGSQDPIVDTTLFNRVQSLLGNRTYLKHQTTFGHQLVECAHCGLKIVGEPRSRTLADGTTKVYTYYRCTAVGELGHPRIRMTEDALDHQVRELFRSIRASDEDVQEWFRSTLRVLAQDAGQHQQRERGQLASLLSLVETRLVNLLSLRLDGEIDANQYREQQAKMLGDKASLIARIESLGQQSAEDSDLIIETFELSQRLLERWDTADFASRREILMMIASNWRLEGETLVPELRMPFQALAEGLATLEAENGRGERLQPFRYNDNPLLGAVLRGSPFRAVWSKAVEMAGWRPLPPQKPRARFNGTTFKVRGRGFKTLAQICEASGVPNTTLRRWLGNRVPELPLINGIRAVADADFADYVELCRREYLTAKRTRNKADVSAKARRRSCDRETG